MVTRKWFTGRFQALCEDLKQKMEYIKVLLWDIAELFWKERNE